MAKFKASFNSFTTERGFVTEVETNKTETLHSMLGIETKALFLPVPLDQTKGNVQQFNYIRSAFKKVWDKMFGDGIASQFLANMLFEQFLVNFPKAEKLLIEWVCGKLNIPLTPELTPELIDKLNGLIDDEISFVEEFKALMLIQEKPISVLKKIWLWLNNTLKFLYTGK